MGREEHLICSRYHPFEPEQQQEGCALTMDLFRWGWGREGWGEEGVGWGGRKGKDECDI